MSRRVALSESHQALGLGCVQMSMINRKTRINFAVTPCKSGECHSRGHPGAEGFRLQTLRLRGVEESRKPSGLCSLRLTDHEKSFDVSLRVFLPDNAP